MLNTPMDVLPQFPVRKNRKQKQAFRDAICDYARSMGYDTRVEKGSLGSRNVLIGNPYSAKYLITAHYDTPARMFLPNFLTPCNFVMYLIYQLLMTFVMMLPSIVIGYAAGRLANDFETGYFVWYFCFLASFALMMFGPANPNNANDNTSGVVAVLNMLKMLPQANRSDVCFVLFDLEEMGLVGSKSYQKAHKDATQKQIVLNLDCVGDGDTILAFPTKQLRKSEPGMGRLSKLNGSCKEKSVRVHERGFYVYPSDQRNFPYGVGIAAFRKNKYFGYYCDRIHTKRDTILDQENIKLLCDRLLMVITE